MASRRRFIGATLAAAAGAAFDALSASPALAQAACGLEAPTGERLRTIPLEGISHRDTPFHTPVGGPGLDTRQFTDLSTLAPDRLITPTPQVFVRTAPPPQLPPALDAWSISLQGHAGPRALTIADLRALSRPMGAHLVECAGNSDPDNFGLLSVAEWDGVPLDTLLPRLAPQPSDYGLLVSGLDDETATPRSSTPGASWILPLADARAQRAFLATRMNGDPLPREHGAPVRLVVPGWYGCAWIKWVTDVRLVDAGAPVTSQMAEFAARTHQPGEPLRARAYEPPAIDVAATPIRVEQWRVQGRTEYRVIGIVWGGDATPGELAIRFGARDAWRRFSVCRSALAPAAWSLWAYTWRPEAPGTYDIALSCPDARVRTRRLDLFYYVRRVRIDDV